MITLLSLGMMAVGILAIRARSISRTVGTIWIDLQVDVTIAYILIIVGLDIFDRYFGLGSDLKYVISETMFVITLNTYLLCAFKITVGLVRYREKSPLLSLVPYALELIYLLVLNPINHIAYFADVRGIVTIERIVFIIICTFLSVIYAVISVFLVTCTRSISLSLMSL